MFHLGHINMIWGHFVLVNMLNIIISNHTPSTTVALFEWKQLFARVSSGSPHQTAVWGWGLGEIRVFEINLKIASYNIGKMKYIHVCTSRNIIIIQQKGQNPNVWPWGGGGGGVVVGVSTQNIGHVKANLKSIGALASKLISNCTQK